MERRLRTFAGSTRARVLLGALVLLAGTIALTIVADRALLLSRLDDRIDDDLQQEVGEFEKLATDGIDPETGEPFGDDVEAIFETFFQRNVPSPDEVFLGLVDGEPVVRSADAPYPVDRLPDVVAGWANTTRPSFDDVATPGGEMRALVVPVTEGDELLGTFVVGRFPASERAEVDEAVRIAAIVGVAAFALAALAAWVIAGRVLSPLAGLAGAAAEIREDRLDHRVEVHGSGELADLGRTFNGMLDRLEGAFDAQRAFLDDAGHELRTPITVIRGHLELADPDRPLGDDTRALVFDELDRMARIVEDLLVIAKAERPDFVDPAPVDVGDLTHDIAAKGRPIGDRTWEVRATPAVADLDRERITQAWMNLLRNAVQHTVEGDRITVFSTVSDGELELGVADTGEGVPSGDRERIFDRFARGSSSRRTRSDGAGLGLAIASAIADAHGGRLSLRDTPGGGATFTLHLPIEEPGDQAPSDPDDQRPAQAQPAETQPASNEPTEEVPWPAS